ncbi:hypothetical protein Taro_017088 [Colocasia esculenta]|uniref:Uncharacterized protein n=1 Tax=Colocasia esculenta TaxID=4460 RepID=A0A843UM78_COLES|nr:hypothetical protein [Colocasia esculenta]
MQTEKAHSERISNPRRDERTFPWQKKVMALVTHERFAGVGEGSPGWERGFHLGDVWRRRIKEEGDESYLVRWMEPSLRWFTTAGGDTKPGDNAAASNSYNFTLLVKQWKRQHTTVGVASSKQRSSSNRSHSNSSSNKKQKEARVRSGRFARRGEGCFYSPVGFPCTMARQPSRCRGVLLTPLEEFKQYLSTVIRWLSTDEGRLSTNEVYLSISTEISEILGFGSRIPVDNTCRQLLLSQQFEVLGDWVCRQLSFACRQPPVLLSEMTLSSI